MQLWDDPRVVRGMQAQLELRRRRLADGDAALGWKVGFGAPAMLELLKISGPLVGFLTQNARVQSGGSVSFAGWSKPIAEPEIAVHIGHDLPGGADHVVGWTVLKPGARHERHLHRNCDEFFIVIKGRGHIYSDLGEEPSVEGDVVYSPRSCWHGFNNTSNEDVVLVWGWMGAGSIEASGYENHPEGHS